jgi:hypothetical protein
MIHANEGRAMKTTRESDPMAVERPMGTGKDVRFLEGPQSRWAELRRAIRIF